MRSALSYTPRPGILQRAAPGAAIAYLGALVVLAFLYSSPLVLAATGIAAAIAGVLAGAARAVRAAVRLGFTLALLITVVNGLVTDRGDTVLARLGEWPLLGQVNVTAEALAAGAVIGLRAAVAMIALAVYSACVDPDLVLRLLRPLAGRSALTATLISRMVPLAAADASRLSEAAALRGPAAAPVGRGPWHAGSSPARSTAPSTPPRRWSCAATASIAARRTAAGAPSRHDRRLYLAGRC